MHRQQHADGVGEIFYLFYLGQQFGLALAWLGLNWFDLPGIWFGYGGSPKLIVGCGARSGTSVCLGASREAECGGLAGPLVSN
jgi:hypothetical protein